MKRIFNYHITKTDEQEHKNILGFLKSRGYSHAVITHLKRTEKGIEKNSEWARVSDMLKEGDLLTIRLIEDEGSSQILPVHIPLNIVYEDEDLMIINKPAGMPIHPSQGNHDNTLANALCYYFKEKGIPFTYRCINRLDRDTTGLLIVAKHMYSASLLSNMVAKREIHREYLALATGEVPEEGVITAPIARKEDSTIERVIDEERGEFARTNFRRLEYKNGYSLVSLILDTGRTHQIRVHMKHLGHPLPGDFLYNPDYSFIKRQALHSYRLSFVHPILMKEFEFIAPLPDDMKL